MSDFVYEGKPYSSRGGRERTEQHAVSLLYDREGNRKYLTVSERTAFLEAAKKLPAHAWTYCLMLAYTGGRESEVLALKPSQIDFDTRLVVIRSLKKRRVGVFRAVPLPPSILLELERVHGIRAAGLDPELRHRPIWNMGRTTAWKWVKKGMAAARVVGPRASPKGLRHSFAVVSLQADVPVTIVQRWLGHSRLSTTEIYAQAVGEEEQAIASRFWGTFPSNGGDEGNV
jgi:integrase/recombinase XerD